MKRYTYIFIIILSSISLFGQNITGKWNGILKVQGIQLRVVFNIEQNEEGYSSTMDSPDQNVKGIPVNSTTFIDSILTIEITNARIKYNGKLNKENVFIGTFKQGMQSFVLSITRKKIEKKVVRKPQEPIKPYPYYSEDIKFNNTKDKIELAGTLTMPSENGIYPAVILISGSGPQDRNEEILGHKPFLVLSDYLTKNGIAVLRYDDRGVGESTGDFKQSTSADFATDVEAAIEYLESRDEIDKSKIGLMGHSEGGLIAPMVAANNQNISFIVLLAGTGLPGDELLLLQQKLIGEASGMDEKELKKAGEMNKGAFDLVKKHKDQKVLKSKMYDHLKQSLIDYPDSLIPSDLTRDNFIKMQVNQFTTPWMSWFIKYDPYTSLKEVKCSVLAVNGEKDLQVPPKENLDAINAGLKIGNNTDITTIVFPDLNHLFQECNTGSPSEYSEIEQTFSPFAMEKITEWILQKVK